MTIYIAGKITGDPNYYAKFINAEQRLREVVFGRHDKDDITIINPARREKGQLVEYYAVVSMKDILNADEAVFLPDWIESKGARFEHALCEYLGKRISYLT